MQRLSANPLGTALSSLTRVSQVVHNHMYDAFVSDNDAVSLEEKLRAIEELKNLSTQDHDDVDIV